MRRKITGGADPLRYLGLEITRAVFATLGVEADEIFKRCANPGQLIGKLKQREKGTVLRHQPKITVKDGDALIEQVQPGLQHVLAQVGQGRRVFCKHRSILVQRPGWNR